MKLLETPKAKVFAACAALVVLLAMGSAAGASSASVARLVLGLVSVAGMGFWFVRAKGGLGAPAKKFELAPRLSVISRTGLSQKAGVALVEVDGRPYLVVHGDGFAEVHATVAAKKPLVRRRAAVKKAVQP